MKLWLDLKCGYVTVPVFSAPKCDMPKKQLGHFDPIMNRILILNRLPTAIAQATLFHEGAHAKLFHVGSKWWARENALCAMTAATFEIAHENGWLTIPEWPGA